MSLPTLPFKILESQSGYGKLGYSSSDGHDEVIIHQGSSDLIPVSIHAPSKLVIETQQPLTVKGYSSPTIESCPLLTFKCNGQVVGLLKEPGRKTLPIQLSPGRHELIVETNFQSGYFQLSRNIIRPTTHLTLGRLAYSTNYAT
jgi:hypothetical protein